MYACDNKLFFLLVTRQALVRASEYNLSVTLSSLLDFLVVVRAEPVTY
jgi:hypothetical protein